MGAFTLWARFLSGADYGSEVSDNAAYGTGGDSHAAESSSSAARRAAQQYSTRLPESQERSGSVAEGSERPSSAHQRALHGSANWGKRLVDAMKEKDQMDLGGTTRKDPERLHAWWRVQRILQGYGGKLEALCSDLQPVVSWL